MNVVDMLIKICVDSSISTGSTPSIHYGDFDSGKSTVVSQGYGGWGDFQMIAKCEGVKYLTATCLVIPMTLPHFIETLYLAMDIADNYKKQEKPLLCKSLSILGYKNKRMESMHIGSIERKSPTEVRYSVTLWKDEYEEDDDDNYEVTENICCHHDKDEIKMIIRNTR